MIQSYIAKKTLFVFTFLFPLITINYAQDGTSPKGTNKSFVIVDSHIHNGFSLNNGKIELSNFEYFAQRKVDMFVFPLPVDRSKTENLFFRISNEIKALRLLAERTKKFKIVDTLDSDGKKSRKQLTNVVLSIEYFDGIFGNDLNNVEKYYDLGVKYITIVDSESERLFEKEKLTPFGRELITTMNKVGVVIDISHLSDDRKITAIDYSNTPVIVSHSNTRKLANINYNLSDKVLDSLNDKNGFVFVSFNENGLYKGDNRKTDGINQFTNHIEYLIKTLGYDYVGIGSDYQADGKYIPSQLNETTKYTIIKDKLLERGHSSENVNKIMGKNILKVLGIY